MRVSCFPITTDDILVTYDKKITPKQQEFLRGLNFHEYPTIQELCAANVENKTDTYQNLPRKRCSRAEAQPEQVRNKTSWGGQYQPAY